MQNLRSLEIELDLVLNLKVVRLPISFWSCKEQFDPISKVLDMAWLVGVSQIVQHVEKNSNLFLQANLMY